MDDRTSLRNFCFGLLAIATMVGLVCLAIAQFNRKFTASDTLTLVAPRSGLLMDTGAAVKYHGVDVGRVAAVTADADGARLRLQMNPTELNKISANVKARIIPPTVFGSKFVELAADAGDSSGGPLRDGSVIHASDVTVELNSTFDAVMRALNTLDPVKLNEALGPVAEGLSGNGNAINNIIRRLNNYLREFNPHLDQVVEMLPPAARVVDDLSRSLPPLIDAANNLGVTSDTLVEQQTQFSAFWASLIHFGNTTTDFLTGNGGRLVTALDVLKPTTAAFARYSPALPCFLAGESHLTDLFRAMEGGTDLGGVHQNLSVDLGFLPGQPSYTNPEDLAKTGVDTGPNCWGLPDVGDQNVPFVKFDVGADPYPNDSRDVAPGWLRYGSWLLGDRGEKRAGHP